MSNLVKKLSTKSSQITPVPHSLFDEDIPDPNPSFWSKNDLKIDGKKINLVNGFFFYKKSKKKFGELKPVFISLYKNYLISSKTKEGMAKQYKSVDLNKHFVTLQKLQVSSSKYATGLSLFYNQKQIDLYSKSVTDQNAFLYNFKKSIIQTNFEDIYVLDKKLGSGSYADVYRVRDKLTRRDYAAKFFDISSFKDLSRSKVSLKNEINIHRQLEHGNICRLHEIYETSTHIIIVMEYAKGERLIDYVIERSPLPEKESLMIIKELLEAVSYMHSLEIIHRDIKLENVLISKDANGPERLSIKLIDFGLSVTSDNIELFKKSGTPGYVAPEILLAETYNTKVDVFSLGVILFTMLSGRSPFVGPDRVSVLRLNKKCEFTLKPKHWDNKSQNVKELVKKMMEADPEKRISVDEALSHRCFSSFNIGGFQSLKTLPRDTIIGRPLHNDGPREDKGIEKSKTLCGPEPTEKKSLHNHPSKQYQNRPDRSSSLRPMDSLILSKTSLSKKNSNLLQIPQSNAMLASCEGEEEKGASDVPLDGINKGSIRTFYKLNSDVNTEDPPSPAPEQITKEKEPKIVPGAETEIPGEWPNIKDKVLCLREVDKSLKSPFKLSARQSLNRNIQNEEPANPSCDLSGENDERPIMDMPALPIVFKASMMYIKKTSRISEI